MAQSKKKVTKKAGRKKKVTKKKVAKRTTVKKPAAKKGPAKKAVVRKKVAKKKTTKRVATAKKVTKKKATKKPTAKKPTAKEAAQSKAAAALEKREKEIIELSQRLPAVRAAGDKTRKANTKWHARFLAALEITGDVGQAAAVAGVSRRTAYHHRENSKAFADAWQDTFETKVDELESSCMLRATHGLIRHTYFKAIRLDSYRCFETSLSIFMLKKCRPERYSDKANEGTGFSPEEYAAEVRELIAAMHDTVPTTPPDEND